MTAFDVLRDEHRRIERMLTILEAAADLIEQGRDAPAYLTDLLDFFRFFADAHHHAKEEERLFPILVAGRFAPQYGVVDALKHQHELGRTLVGEMRVRAAHVCQGDRTAAGAFAASARSYVELLRVHIQIEDHDVFPEAEKDLTAEEERVLRETFVELDSSQSAAQAAARWERLADQAAAAGR